MYCLPDEGILGCIADGSESPVVSPSVEASQDQCPLVCETGLCGNIIRGKNLPYLGWRSLEHPYFRILDLRKILFPAVIHEKENLRDERWIQVKIHRDDFVVQTVSSARIPGPIVSGRTKGAVGRFKFSWGQSKLRQ